MILRGLSHHPWHLSRSSDRLPLWGHTTCTDADLGGFWKHQTLIVGQAALDCESCHKAQGEGGIGPNFTDQYWIHGGSAQDIYYTIKVGVVEKGMIAWEDILSPTKIADVTSFINTFQGTNPPNAKAPQGELYKVEEQPATDNTDEQQITI